MARGFESKSVESQQDDFKARKQNNRANLSAEEKAALHDRDELTLARASLQQRIEASGNPRLREMLKRALQDVEQKLNKFQQNDRK